MSERERTLGVAAWIDGDLCVVSRDMSLEQILTVDEFGNISGSDANKARIVAGWDACVGIGNPDKVVPGLVKALRVLLFACDQAGAEGELSDYVDGTYLDDARDALALAEAGS